MSSELLVPPTLGGRCALCGGAFRIGDSYKSVWRKRRLVGPIGLGLSLHQACFAQLAPGDLTRLFAALERRLALPLRVLGGGEFGVRPPEAEEFGVDVG